MREDNEAPSLDHSFPRLFPHFAIKRRLGLSERLTRISFYGVAKEGIHADRLARRAGGEARSPYKLRAQGAGDEFDVRQCNVAAFGARCKLLPRQIRGLSAGL